MKAITTYRCEVCGETFESAEKCKICEDSHVHPAAIVERPESYDAWQAYPKRVGIKFQDGMTLTYVRTDVTD